MKSINYLSSFTVGEDVHSYAVASHLWHLSHIFKTLDFTINGITRNSLIVTRSFRSALKNGRDNFFLISLCDSDVKRIIKHTEVIMFILHDRYPNIKIEFKLVETVPK